MTLLEQQIESLVDQHGVVGILQALNVMCEAKADHIAGNCGTGPLYLAWATMASPWREQ